MDIVEFLDQETVWITADGARTKISEMSADHAALSARWLAQNSTGLILIAESAINEGALNGDGDVSDVLALVAQSPRDWIARKPLYRALVRVAQGR